MSDILFAKEVYVQHTTNKPETVHKMIPVSGLYITGVWRPPHYIEQHLFVTNIGGTDADIQVFTQDTKNVHPSNYACGISKLEKTSSTFVMKYSQDTKNVRPSNYACGISKLEQTSNTYVVKYSNITKNVHPSNYACGISKLEISDDLEIGKPHHIQHNTQASGKPTILIKGISGAKATITISNS